MTPRFVGGSDLHCEYHAYATHPQMWGDSYYALEQEVDMAIQLKIPLVLAGDLFDKPYPDSYTLKRFFQQMDRCQEAKVQVLFTQGQHEMSRRQPWLTLHPWPAHLHQRIFRCSDDCVLYGMDYVPPDRLKEEVARIHPDATVLVCHQVWGEFMVGLPAMDGMMAELVPPGIKMVLTGDYHSHQVKVVERADGSKFQALSPGASTLQHIGEDPAKYFFVVHEGPGGVLQPESKPLRNRRVIYDRVHTAEQLKKLNTDMFTYQTPLEDESLPVNLQQPMWAVSYDPIVPDVVATLTKAAQGRAHLFLRILENKEEKDAIEDTVAPVSSLTDALATVVDPDTPVYNTALRLLTAVDPKASLQELIDEALAKPPEEVDPWSM